MRTEIVIDNKIVLEVNLFKYLGNMMSYEGELDTDNKLTLWRRNYFFFNFSTPCI